MKKKTKQTIKRPVKHDRAGFLRRLLTMMLFALCAGLIAEGFNQGSVPRMIAYLTRRPLYFGLNCLIILAFLSISELFRRRIAMLWTLAAVWSVLGIANYLVVRNRTLPLAGGDLLLDYEMIRLGFIYFSWMEIILTLVASVALIAGLAWLFSHTAVRRRVNYSFGGCVVAIMVLLVFCTHMMYMKAGALPETFPDRVNSYKDYGFTTCFVVTFGQQGIDKPEEYSSETVEEILDEVDEALPEEEAHAYQRFNAEAIKHPNILFLQLESFFDVDNMLDTELSDDPTPYYHSLLKEWPNADLYVPTIGGGTANVEFEVMSGLNMDFFGAGETPYNTIIQENVCETIANTLRDHGYVSTAMHDNTGTFFNRNLVYANLGYDRFDSLEYMPNPKYNEVGWAQDIVLRDEILRALEITDAQDLIFAIGVESHGKYGDTYTPEADDIQVLSAPEEIFYAPFQNYVNLIRPVDDFLRELLADLADYDEPIVAVIYGDHLPGIGLNKEMLANGDLYASRYIIWNNYGAEFEAQDMQAYRLSADLLRQLGVTDGVMTKFHQAYAVNETGDEYMEKLKILEYDMLYGDQEIYGEAGAPQPTQLQMGLEPIRVESAVLEYGRLMVTGAGFTEYSKILSGDQAVDTVFVDDAHIVALVDSAQAQKLGESICVAQLNYEGVELSRTPECAVRRERISKDAK